MNGTQDGGYILSREDQLILYPLLKSVEDRLLPGEYRILMDLEKNLYRHLSIQDVARLIELRKA